jgi:hypothetical protein
VFPLSKKRKRAGGVMSQPSLHAMLGIARPDRERAGDGKLEIYDFFAGAGACAAH